MYSVTRPGHINGFFSESREIMQFSTAAKAKKGINPISSPRKKIITKKREKN